MTCRDTHIFEIGANFGESCVCGSHTMDFSNGESSVIVPKEEKA